jgi:hypothetical protein
MHFLKKDIALLAKGVILSMKKMVNLCNNDQSGI